MSSVVGIVIFLVGLFGLFIISELYAVARKKLNTPKIGIEILLNLLERNDYVCIDGKVNQFSHFAKEDESLNILSPPCESNKTIGGEIAFVNNHGLGYMYYNPSILVNCDFIFGKYGLKWARNIAIANTANEKIKKYRYE